MPQFALTIADLIGTGHEIWGEVSLAIAVCAYIPYVKSVLAGQTRPHAFSWIIWGLLAMVAFVGQIKAGGGAGAWLNAFIAFVCFAVTIIALIKNQQKITKSDWASFVAACLTIPLWLATGDPFYAMLLVTAIDTLAFYPTFRKSWVRPYEEAPSAYILFALQYAASILAMESFNGTTVFYPSWMASMNILFVAMVSGRRHALAKSVTQESI